MIRYILLSYIRFHSSDTIVLTNKNNEVNVTKHVNSIREDETASYADSKEYGKWSVERRNSTRDDPRGWLAEGNLRSFQSPGREQNYHRKGRGQVKNRKEGKKSVK